ncbi:MAG TPA: protein-glutamate O-methyltransferase CheR [bacterium]
MQHLLKKIPAALLDKRHFFLLGEILREKRMFNISCYREGTIRRRISARLKELNIPSMGEYITLLQSENGEVDRLISELTIHVSSFFRDPDIYEELEEEILPSIFDRQAKEKDKKIRLLSLGCSSGEEPYSIAIILLEKFSKYLSEYNIKIISMDVDNRSIQKAQAGLYLKRDLSSLSESLLKKYFSEEDNEVYKIGERVKHLVEFKRSNAISEPLPDGMDIVFCRNFLIYFNRDTQLELIKSIVRSLKNGGYIVLGKTDGILSFLVIDGIDTIDSHKRIYIWRGGDNGSGKKKV